METLLRLAVQEGQNVRAVRTVAEWLGQHRLIAEGREIRRCEECERLYVVHDARQRYCTQTCGGRDRGRRLRERRRAYLAAPPPDKDQPRLPLM